MATTKQVAKKKGKSARTIRRWAKQGKLPGSSKPGRDWDIKSSGGGGSKKRKSGGRKKKR